MLPTTIPLFASHEYKISTPPPHIPTQLLLKKYYESGELYVNLLKLSPATNHLCFRLLKREYGSIQPLSGELRPYGPDRRPSLAPREHRRLRR